MGAAVFITDNNRRNVACSWCMGVTGNNLGHLYQYMNNHLESTTGISFGHKIRHLCVKNLRNSQLLRAILALIWQILNHNLIIQH